MLVLVHAVLFRVPSKFAQSIGFDPSSQFRPSTFHSTFAVLPGFEFGGLADGLIQQ